MITTAMQIADLITVSGQTGPQMTHALKILGNGDMQQGLIRIAKFFLAEGKRYIIVGRLQGVVGGAAGVVIIFLLIKLVMDRQDNIKQKEEAKNIIDAFKDYLPPEVGQESKTQE